MKYLSSGGKKKSLKYVFGFLKHDEFTSAVSLRSDFCARHYFIQSLKLRFGNGRNHQKKSTV